MDDVTIDVMEAMRSCRCCLLRPPDKGLKTLYAYTHLGKTEIYSDMLKDCLNIDLQLILGDDECGICDTCVGRLRDASDFKQQVQRSQALLEKALRVKDQKPCIKLEKVISLDLSNEGEIQCEDNDLSNLEITVERISNRFASESVPKDKTSDACDTCGKTFEDEASLTNHMHDHTKQEAQWDEHPQYTMPNPADIFKCDICEALFTKKDSLAKHIAEDHTKKQKVERRHACHVCQKKFIAKSHLNEHLNAHTRSETNWFPCDVCNLQFKHKCALNKHMRLHKDEGNYNCDVCKKQLSSRRTLRAHRRIHTGQKAYPQQSKPKKKPISEKLKKDICCEVCGKVFRNNSAFAIHMNGHTGQKPYSCEICHKKFTQKGIIKDHMRIHTGEKPHSCKICDKPFTSKAGVRSHMFVHSEEKAHTCKICSKQFKYKAALVTHFKLIHSGRKPYSCNVCGKAFALSCLLKRHSIVHTGERPYCCDVCNKGLTTKSQLRRHLKIHFPRPNVVPPPALLHMS